MKKWAESALMGFIWVWYMCLLAVRNRKIQAKQSRERRKVWILDTSQYHGVG